jgi:hypothetical protein
MSRSAVLQGPGSALCSLGCQHLPPCSRGRQAGWHHAASGMPPGKRYVASSS